MTSHGFISSCFLLCLRKFLKCFQIGFKESCEEYKEILVWPQMIDLPPQIFKILNVIW